MRQIVGYARLVYKFGPNFHLHAFFVALSRENLSLGITADCSAGDYSLAGVILCSRCDAGYYSDAGHQTVTTAQQGRTVQSQEIW